ncbi:MAG: hypothetical protein HY815_33335 [Candidatus Riflebacteria bacterium]|nr:hypothetical protein [Candidatus Riflebacteria bacterium]
MERLVRVLVLLLAMVCLPWGTGCGPRSALPGIAVAVPPDASGTEPGPIGNALTVTGLLQYQKIVVTVNAQGQVTNKSTVNFPIRFADVLALDGVTKAEIQVQPCATDATGNFKLFVPKGKTFYVSVRASTSNSTSRANLAVHDPTTNAIQRVDFVDKTTGQPFNPPAGTTSMTVTGDPIPASPSSERPSGIFNILDAGLVASDKVRDVRGSPLDLLRFFWTNVDTAVSLSGSYFVSSDTQGLPAVFIRGGSNSDTGNTDEFDDPIIDHEYGHFVLFRISRDQSLGGGHYVGDYLYPTLAWSEGFSDCFAGISLGQPLIYDIVGITGPAPTAGVLNLEGGRPAGSNRGIKVEASVAEVVWDLVDGAENRPNSDNEQYNLTFAQIYSALVALRAKSVYTTVEDFLTALVNDVQPAPISAANVTSLVTTTPEPQGMTFPPTGDDVFPPALVFGDTRNTSCVTRNTGQESLTGTEVTNRFYKFTVAAQQSVTVNVSVASPWAGTNANGSNIDLYVLTLDNAFALSTTGIALTPEPRPEAIQETGTGTLAQGDYIIYVNGRPNISTGVLTNTASNTVTFRLSLTSP